MHTPVLSQWFDLKEHTAALALALIVAAALAGRVLARGRGEGEWQRAAGAIAALSCSAALLVWVTALIGLSITARRPLGMP